MCQTMDVSLPGTKQVTLQWQERQLILPSPKSAIDNQSGAWNIKNCKQNFANVLCIVPIVHSLQLQDVAL